MIREAMLYGRENAPDVDCRLCRHACRIPPGKRGTCGVRINREGIACINGTEPAVPRTPVAEYHEGSGSPLKTLGQIGTAGALTDGVQSVLTQELFHLVYRLL